MRSFYTDTVTRMRAPDAVDGHGNTAPDWSGVVESVSIGFCRVQPVTAEENMLNRYESVLDARLLAPLGSDVTYLDRIVADGVLFEVVGPSRSFRSPSGAAEHDEILLRRVTG